MDSPLARALLKIGAVLLAFSLLGLGVWFGVIKTTDDRLLNQLRAVPGLTGVRAEGGRVVVTVASDLDPAAAQACVDQVARIAKNQQLYRSRPVELVQGVFTATMTASAPGVAPGRYRGDVANVLSSIGGMSAGTLGPTGAVEVQLPNGAALLDWTLRAAQLIEQQKLRVDLQVSRDDTTLALNAGVEFHRQLLSAAHRLIIDSGTTIKTLTVQQHDAGTRLAGDLGAPDRSSATRMLQEMAALLVDPTAGTGLEVQIAGDLRLAGVGNATDVLAFVDHLAAEDLEVTWARTDRSRVMVEVERPEAIDTLLAKATDPGWTLGPEAELVITPELTTRGGVVAGNANLESRVRAYQRLWLAGFPDIFVGSGDASRGAQIGFTVSAPDQNDYTAAGTQKALITALRSLGWAGRAGFSLNCDPRASTLTFFATVNGRAGDVVLPRALGGRWWHRTNWGQRFIERWDASATG